MIDDLAIAVVLAELARAGAKLGTPMTIVRETASTNDDARAALVKGAVHGATFVADSQTKGRGRGGHVWHSPAGENLYLSVVARTKVEPARVSATALVVGVAVARAVERFGSIRARIKWPNDVEISGRKIAGVLVEAQIRGGAVDALLIGVGLNVLTQKFPVELGDRATSLAREGAVVTRALALATFLAELGDALRSFEASGLAPFHPELEARDALRGARVRAGEIEGRGAGINAVGQLLVEDDAGAVHLVTSGSALRLDDQCQSGVGVA